MTGMDRYDDKRKRAMRRRNHIARDLANRKYRQRRVEGKKPRDYDYDMDEFLDSYLED